MSDDCIEVTLTIDTRQWHAGIRNLVKAADHFVRAYNALGRKVPRTKAERRAERRRLRMSLPAHRR